MKRDKSIPIFFYRSGNGKEPVREFLQELSVEEKKIVGTDLMVVQWRWPVGEPLVKNRILFAQVFDKLVLLHAFIKKTQKTDDKDIKLAIKRLKEIENEK